MVAVGDVEELSDADRRRLGVAEASWSGGGAGQGSALRRHGKSGREDREWQTKLPSSGE